MSSYISIDPGDRWVGIALLYRNSPQIDIEDKPIPAHVRRAQWKFGALVLDRKDKKLRDTMGEIEQQMDFINADRLIVESYQIRQQQGFNSFSGGETLKLIGAIELMSQTYHQIPMFMVQPNNPVLAQQLWSRAWDEIRGMVDRRVAREQRSHAYSAWRCLGHHMMQHDLQTLQRIHRES